MMLTKSLTTLSDATAERFAERARRMDGCVYVGSGAYEFAQNSTVVCLISLDPPAGYMGKDGKRADEIRKSIAAAKATP